MHADKVLTCGVTGLKAAFTLQPTPVARFPRRARRCDASRLRPLRRGRGRRCLQGVDS